MTADTSEARRAARLAAQRERNRRYRQAHAEALREAKRRYQAENREAVRERKRRYRQANAEAIREYQHHWQAANAEAVRVAQLRYYETIRTTVLGHYSPGPPPCCACCGTTEKLTVDHVDGNGTAHRMEVFGRNQAGVPFYRWLIAEDFPAGYQVLCKLCNASKHDGERCQLDHAVLVPVPALPGRGE